MRQQQKRLWSLSIRGWRDSDFAPLSLFRPRERTTQKRELNSEKGDLPLCVPENGGEAIKKKKKKKYGLEVEV